MNKAIKIIDLLNKIANEEEVPEKIKLDGDIYNCKISNEGAIDYYSDIEDRPNLWLFKNHNTLALNKEIELIEDEIDIQSIEEIDDIIFDLDNMGDDEIENYHNSIRIKINELIQALKQLDKKMEDKNK